MLSICKLLNVAYYFKAFKEKPTASYAYGFFILKIYSFSWGREGKERKGEGKEKRDREGENRME